jgi:hypothetical protein
MLPFEPSGVFRHGRRVSLNKGEDVELALHPAVGDPGRPEGGARLVEILAHIIVAAERSQHQADVDIANHRGGADP